MTPDDRKYSKDHEWALLSGGVATIGITQFAVESLSDVVYVDLPEIGSDVVQFEKFGEIESGPAKSSGIWIASPEKDVPQIICQGGAQDRR